MRAGKTSEAKRSGRVEEAQKTREALIAAAMQLFVEEGLTRPSLDAICARAGFTRGAFYVHFRTRDELIAAVVESAMSGFIDAMIGAKRSDGSVAPAEPRSGGAGDGGPSRSGATNVIGAKRSDEAGADLGTIVRTFAAAARWGSFPFVGQVRGHQIMEACLRSPTLQQKYIELLANARERLSDTVRRGQAAGTIRPDVDPSAIAQLLLALVLGVQVASEVGAPYDADRVGEDVLRMLAPDATSRRSPRSPRG